jgi:DNA-binding CsgD family transcriptional regulator
MTGEPRAVTTSGPAVLCVGRELEQARLRRHLEAAQRGLGGLVLVEGPAGLGKTTLASWCASWAARAGGSVHLVGALGPERELPVGLWARLAASATVAGHAVPDVLLDGAVEHLHPHDRYAALVELLRAMAPSPVVVVLDDLHRADESSLVLLAQVAPTLAGTGVLVVGTSRGASTHPTPAGRDSLESLGAWASAIELTQLDTAGVRAVAVALAGPGSQEWARGVQSLLTERSGGNPLVLRSILDELGVTDGARPAARTIASLPVDAAVGTMLARRLATLPRAGIDVLHAAAAIGGDVPVAALAEVLGRPVDDDVELALAAGVVEPAGDGEIRFVHPAAAESVTARGPADPAALHLRIAQWLRARGQPHDLPAIAHHLALASRLVAADEVALAGVEAAEHALRVGDPSAAARGFDIALGTDAVDDVVDLLLRSSAAHHLAGHRHDGWERARRAADKCGDDDPESLARAALGYAVARDYSTDTADAVDLLRRALRVLPRDHPLRPDVLAALSLLEMSLPIQGAPPPLPGREDDLPADAERIAWHWITRPEIARPLADEALALARATGDEERVARIAMTWRQSYCAPEHLDDRLAATTHALAHARAPEDRVLAAVASVLDHLECGRRDAVDAALAELHALGETTGDPAVRWRTRQLGAMVALASGRPVDAEALSEEAFTHGAQAGEDGRFVVRTIQAAMTALEAAADSHATIEHLASNLDDLGYPPIRAGAIAALADAGRRAPATRALPSLVAHVAEDPGREASWLLTAAFTADAVASVGDVDAARRLLPPLLPFAERITVDGLGIHCHGCLARPLGRLAVVAGDDARAAELVALGQRIEAAAGLRRFVLEGALDALALGLAPAAGAPADEHAIAAEADTLGLRRTARRARERAVRNVVSPLTARQHAVLAALADDLTYQAAAERLGFSHSTIRHEAMRIYDALGARDRTEAVRIARERGILRAGDA